MSYTQITFHDLQFDLVCAAGIIFFKYYFGSVPDHEVRIRITLHLLQHI